MDILISDRWRLRRMDEKNFELEEWRKPSADNRKAKSDEPRWYGTGHYFQCVGHALEWLLHHRCINDPGECADLHECLERMEGIAAELHDVRVEA